MFTLEEIINAFRTQVVERNSPTVDALKFYSDPKLRKQDNEARKAILDRSLYLLPKSLQPFAEKILQKEFTYEPINHKFTHVFTTRRTGIGRRYVAHIHKSQLKYIARELFRSMVPFHCFDSVIVESLGFSKLNRHRQQMLSKLVKTIYARHLINTFYGSGLDDASWFYWIGSFRTIIQDRQDYVYYSDKVAHLVYDAIGLGKKVTLDPKFRTVAVMDLIRIMRQKDDLSVMPILADALQDAGFDNEEILKHYRGRTSEFSLGSWIFRATGNLDV